VQTGDGPRPQQRAVAAHSGPRSLTSAARGWSVDHAEQRADRKRDTVRQPSGELLEAELVHADFATLVAFAVLCRGVRNAELIGHGFGFLLLSEL
jgi:hypothetical protein